MYGIVGAPDNEVDEAITKRYGSEPDKLSYAQQIAVIAGEYSRNLPKGFNEEKRKRREYRRNAKRVIYEKAKEEIKPVSFIPTFIFLAIISGIIGWIVRRMLDYYFTDSPKGMFSEDLAEEWDGEKDVM